MWKPYVNAIPYAFNKYFSIFTPTSEIYNRTGLTIRSRSFSGCIFRVIRLWWRSWWWAFRLSWGCKKINGLYSDAYSRAGDSYRFPKYFLCILGIHVHSFVFKYKEYIMYIWWILVILKMLHIFIWSVCNKWFWNKKKRATQVNIVDYS